MARNQGRYVLHWIDLGNSILHKNNPVAMYLTSRSKENTICKKFLEKWVTFCRGHQNIDTLALARPDEDNDDVDNDDVAMLKNTYCLYIIVNI